MASWTDFGAWHPSDLEHRELIRRVWEEHDGRAAEALLLHHLPWVNGVAARQGRRRKLGPEEVEQAQVEAAFAVVRALPDFRPDEGCPLRAFLGPVIVNCLRNYARHVRSAERPYDRSPRAAGVFRGGATTGGIGPRAATWPAAATATRPRSPSGAKSWRPWRRYWRRRGRRHAAFGKGWWPADHCGRWRRSWALPTRRRGG